MRSVKSNNRIILALILFAFISGLYSCEKKISVIVNDESLKLSTSFQNGGIKESPKKEPFFEFWGDAVIEEFVESGFGYRIEDCVEKWRFFEDSGYWILMGTVFKSRERGYSFVYVFKDQIKTTGKIDTYYLKIGKTVYIGSEYPKGIIPFN